MKHKLMPKEPPEAIIEAASHACPWIDEEDINDIYDAIYAATPGEEIEEEPKP